MGSSAGKAAGRDVAVQRGEGICCGRASNSIGNGVFWSQSGQPAGSSIDYLGIDWRWMAGRK